MASSRLARDSLGRLIAEVMTSDSADLERGRRLLVLGNDLPCNERGIGWLGASGSTRSGPPRPRPHAALADECFQAAGGDGLAALTLALDVAEPSS